MKEGIDTILISDRFEIAAGGYLEVEEGLNSADHIHIWLEIS